MQSKRCCIMSFEDDPVDQGIVFHSSVARNVGNRQTIAVAT